MCFTYYRSNRLACRLPAAKQAGLRSLSQSGQVAFSRVAGNGKTLLCLPPLNANVPGTSQIRRNELSAPKARQRWRRRVVSFVGGGGGAAGGAAVVAAVTFAITPRILTPVLISYA